MRLLTHFWLIFISLTLPVDIYSTIFVLDPLVSINILKKTDETLDAFLVNFDS